MCLSYFQPLTISNVEHGDQTEEKARFSFWCNDHATSFENWSASPSPTFRDQDADSSASGWAKRILAKQQSFIEKRSAEGLALIYVWQAFFPAFD